MKFVREMSGNFDIWFEATLTNSLVFLLKIIYGSSPKLCTTFLVSNVKRNVL